MKEEDGGQDEERRRRDVQREGEAVDGELRLAVVRRAVLRLFERVEVSETRREGRGASSGLSTVLLFTRRTKRRRGNFDEADERRRNSPEAPAKGEARTSEKRKIALDEPQPKTAITRLPASTTPARRSLVPLTALITSPLFPKKFPLAPSHRTPSSSSRRQCLLPSPRPFASSSDGDPL
jgi:hypothetical protein